MSAARSKSDAVAQRRGAPKTYASAESPATKAPKIVLGDELEYRIARLQLFMGYYVRRGCPIYTMGGLNQATDLDLLAVRYVEPFRRQVMITECKGGDVGPLDRIFWLSGVKTFVKANEALLVRKGTKWDIKDFAKRAGIGILDLYKITELESNFKIAQNEWPGISDRAFFASRLGEWSDALRRNPNWWEFYLTLGSETSYDEPFAAVNYILQQLRILTKTLKRTSSGTLERKLLADGISQLCVFLMRIAEYAFDLSNEDRKGFVDKGLRYGSLDPKFAERFLKTAYNLTRQAIFHYSNRNVEIDEALFRTPTPPGSVQVIEILDDILSYYPASLNLPQICDLILSEVYLKGNRNGGWLRRIFYQSDLLLRIELLRKFLTHLVEAGACPAEVLDSVALNDAEIPQVRRNGTAESRDRNIEDHGVKIRARDSAEEVSNSPSTALHKDADPAEFRLQSPSVPAGAKTTKD